MSPRGGSLAAGIGEAEIWCNLCHHDAEGRPRRSGVSGDDPRRRHYGGRLDDDQVASKAITIRLTASQAIAAKGLAQRHLSPKDELAAA